MGTILKAQCGCGYWCEIYAGGGFENFETTFTAPAFCAKCKKLVTINYMEKQPKCPDCDGDIKFYNDPQLQDKTLINKHPIFTGGSFMLPDTHYLCPNCEEKKMVFVKIGNWD